MERAERADRLDEASENDTGLKPPLRKGEHNVSIPLFRELVGRCGLMIRIFMVLQGDPRIMAKPRTAFCIFCHLVGCPLNESEVELIKRGSIVKRPDEYRGNALYWRLRELFPSDNEMRMDVEGLRKAIWRHLPETVAAQSVTSPL